MVLATVWHARHDRLPDADHLGGWLNPLGSGLDHPLYATLSLIVAICLGTMGLPHVLVRFYTNPDGRDARRTALIVIGLLSVFYQLPTALRRLRPPVPAGAGRHAAGRRDRPAAARADARRPARPAARRLVTAGAFAAFLSTASGLTVSVAGVLSQDVLGRRGDRRQRIRAFRVAAVLSLAVPYALSLAGARVSLAAVVGLAFALAASHVLPAAGARHLVAGADRGRRAGRAGGRRRARRRRRARHARARAARRLARGAAVAAGRLDRAAHLRRHGRRVAGDQRAASRRAWAGCWCRLHVPESMAADLPSIDRSAR